VSHQLIALNPVLKALRDEGYNLEIRKGFLLVSEVPYVNSDRQVKRGTLVVQLELAGDIVSAPRTHVAYFIGEYPCRADGSRIEQIFNASRSHPLTEGLVIDHTFSAKPKPKNAYDDYHHQVTTYVAILEGPAKQIDPNVKAQSARPIPVESVVESVFKYIDTASSRAEIDVITNKLALDKIAIIGAGGTGGYVLDQVAKAPVKEIHLFDNDTFLSHNAFRAPGAASLEDLRAQQKKVHYFQKLYSQMRHGIIAHDVEVNADTIHLLHDMKFVFICIDYPPAKKLIVERLEEWGIPFVDVGMGVYRADDSLGGTIRSTASITEDRATARKKVSFTDSALDDDYALNIQIGDLNALNAIFAVIKWKKMFGFYLDCGGEMHCSYMVEMNQLSNLDTQHEPTDSDAEIRRIHS